jgi:hypothetical protein
MSRHCGNGDAVWRITSPQAEGDSGAEFARELVEMDTPETVGRSGVDRVIVESARRYTELCRY